MSDAASAMRAAPAGQVYSRSGWFPRELDAPGRHRSVTKNVFGVQF